MKNTLYDHGYKIEWENFYVHQREGYYTSVTDFHEHDFYEINLILSGNVKILLPNRAAEGTVNRIVLTKPNTPHFVTCKPDTLYSRMYLLISHEFIANYVPEWARFQLLFGENGRILSVTPEQIYSCKHIIEHIQNEHSLFRQRLLIFYLLSCISEFSENSSASFMSVPAYILETLSYINEHYSEKIIASELAEKLYISRTTLLTGFKKHLGSTLNDYIIHYRLKKVIQLLNEGKTEQEAAWLCGFNDSSSLIRRFKRCYGMTPRQYLKINP